MVAPKTISKPKSKARSKTVKNSKQNEQKRLEINQRERQRTTAMNQAFDELKGFLCGYELSKVEILSMIDTYINFLYRVSFGSLVWPETGFFKFPFDRFNRL